MKTIAILLVSLFFLAAHCSKEGPDCHHSYNIKNNSSDTVIYAIKGQMGSDTSLCYLGGKNLNPGDNEEIIENDCWEDYLANGRIEEFFIIDPNYYNEPNVFYDCDSIEIYNKILKHYVITLEDLQDNDFIITYP
jgi:hypothetical protein